jgi:hypothetical protein
MADECRRLIQLNSCESSDDFPILIGGMRAMRHSMRALLIVLSICLTGGNVVAQESSAPWWPFGRSEETLPPNATKTPFDAPTPAPTMPVPQPQQAITPVLPDEALADDHNQKWMINSPFGKVSWPRLQMPKRPAAASDQQVAADADRNTWVETPVEPPKPSPFESMSNSARTAWKKTVDALTPGDQSQPEDRSSRVARREGQSAWQRMFGSEEPTKKEGSQTIGEFIAQERVDP